MDNNTPYKGSRTSWLLIIPVVLAMSAVVAYSISFHNLPTNENPAAWGAFGDFLGGLLNPLVSGLTLFVAVQVWQLQRVELSETKKVLEDQAKTASQQRGEQRFFDLLNFYLRNLEGMSILIRHQTREDRTVHGKLAIEHWFKENSRDQLLSQGTSNGILMAPEHNTWRERLKTVFIPSYLRVVFRLLMDAEHLFSQHAERYRFMKLFRAQLTPTELELIGLNLWLSDSGVKMRSVVAQYGLLKHMPDGPLRSRLENEFQNEDLKVFGSKWFMSYKNILRPTMANIC